MRSKVEKEEDEEKGKKKKKKKKWRGVLREGEAGKKPRTTKSSYASFLLQNRLFASIHLYFIGLSVTPPPLSFLSHFLFFSTASSLSLRLPLK